jgi:hypothetical protein
MFSSRSHRKELLDEENIPLEELHLNLMELDTINRFLGGYGVSRDALRYVVKREKPEVLVDIGSGGGNTLRRLSDWTRKKNFNFRFYGIDIKQDCVNYSLVDNNRDIIFVCDDYRNVLNHVPDATILHASLFCHHLSDEEIRELIRFAIKNKLTLIINDLHRHPLAYYSIRVLTRLFSSSRLVMNDAPLSVLRGFTAAEWKRLLEEAGAVNYSINAKWAFRHQVIVYHEQQPH